MVRNFFKRKLLKERLNSILSLSLFFSSLIILLYFISQRQELRKKAGGPETTILLGRVGNEDYLKYQACVNKRYLYGGSDCGNPACNGGSNYTITWFQNDKSGSINGDQCYGEGPRYTFEWQSKKPSGSEGGEPARVSIRMHDRNVLLQAWSKVTTDSSNNSLSGSEEGGSFSSPGPDQTVEVKLYKKGDYQWNHLWFFVLPPSPTSAPVTLSPAITRTLTPTPAPTSAIPTSITPFPTPTLSRTDPCSQSYPTQDSYIYYEVPNNNSIRESDTNYGQEAMIILNKGTHTLFGIGFLKFDLSQIPFQAKINSANLRLFLVGWGGLNGGGCETVGNFNIPGRIDLFKVISPWQENTITWNNRPKIDYSRPIAFTKVSNRLGYINFDITSVVRDWQNNPNSNFGLAISLGRDAHLDSETSCKQFYIASAQSKMVYERHYSPWYGEPCLTVGYNLPTPIPMSISCQNLTLDAVVPQLIPGRTVTIGCKALSSESTTAVNHFEFIVRHGGGVSPLPNAPATKTRVNEYFGTVSYRIPNYGCYQFLCRACQSADSSKCTIWGMAN